MYCTNCGKENKLENDFCTNCGTKLRKDNIKKETIKVKNRVSSKKVTIISLIILFIVFIVLITYNLTQNNNFDNINSQVTDNQDEQYMSIQDVYDDFNKQDLQKDISFIEDRKYDNDLIILTYKTIPFSGAFSEIGFITVQENSYIYSRKELWSEAWEFGAEEKVWDAINIEENKRVSEIWNNSNLEYEQLETIETSFYSEYIKNEERYKENIIRQSSNNFTDKIFYSYGSSKTSNSTDNVSSTNIATDQSVASNSNNNLSSNITDNLTVDSNDSNEIQQDNSKKSEQELAKQQMGNIHISIVPKGYEYDVGYLFYRGGGGNANAIDDFIKYYTTHPEAKIITFKIEYEALIDEFFFSDMIDKECMVELGYKIQIIHSETGKSQTINATSDSIYSDEFNLVDGNNTFNITITDKYNNSITASRSFTI